MRTFVKLSSVLLVALLGSAAAADPAKPAGTPDHPILTGSNATLDHTCLEGQDVTLRGSGNVVNITGPCDTVNVDGSQNQVHIDRVVSITAKGDGNLIDWHKGASARVEPVVAANGKGNTIKRRTD